MLTVEEAEKILLSHVPQWSSRRISVSKALGCVLQEAVIAARAQPPFDRAMMDGFAIRYDDYCAGLRRFPIQAIQLAGQAIKQLKPKQCIHIMTGAIVPTNADCIIPIEQTQLNEKEMTLTGDTPVKAQFIHRAGSDYPIGHMLLTAGTRIGSSELGCILSSGISELMVAHNPCIAIITTGNELVRVGKKIKSHQIYATNDRVLSASLIQHGFSNIICDHANDSVDALSKTLSHALQKADVLVITGGVSMGKTDLVPQVLNSLGVEKLFHKVSQRPGKPMWVGKKQHQMIFGLPGNPVSAYVCLRRYVIPALNHALQVKNSKQVRVRLSQAVELSAPLTHFIPAVLNQNQDCQIQATPKFTNTSGDFFSLAGTDGIIELPANREKFHKDQEVSFYPWI